MHHWKTIDGEGQIPEHRLMRKSIKMQPPSVFVRKTPDQDSPPKPGSLNAKSAVRHLHPDKLTSGPLSTTGCMDSYASP